MNDRTCSILYIAYCTFHACPVHFIAFDAYVVFVVLSVRFSIIIIIIVIIIIAGVLYPDVNEFYAFQQRLLGLYILLMNCQPIIADILTVIFTMNREYCQRIRIIRYFNFFKYLLSFSHSFV